MIRQRNLNLTRPLKFDGLTFTRIMLSIYPVSYTSASQWCLLLDPCLQNLGSGQRYWSIPFKNC